jgi:hypothetical protein
MICVTLSVFLLGVIATNGAPQPSISTQNPPVALKNDRGIVWDAQMNFSEPGGKSDYVVFGEATDANDGPPADSYDVVKPPAPIPPYLRAWLNDSLPSPYDVMWKDYRHYPGVHKTWNLSILWIPPGGSPTLVTFTWNKNIVNTSEYDAVSLINSTGVVVANLLTSNTYSYNCPPWVPQAFRINCSADITAPKIVNHSPGTGETGDSYTFNVTVTDDTTPANNLLVKVNWVHGGSSGNDTMMHTTGNTFTKTVTLNNYTVSDLTYHIYAKDASKAHNTNYTPAFSATITDDESPTITGSSGAVSVGTGDAITLWVTGTDNIGVTSAKATVDSVDHAMSWNSSASRWEYVYTAPSGSTASHSYTVTVSDAAANTKTSGPYTITVFDNDPPIIANVMATPASQIINGRVNITATITDNINLREKKVRITGPAGYTPINVSVSPDGANAYYYNASYTLTGVYDYSLWANDTSNNGITSATYQFTIYAELKITTLLAGWNFVSLPFNQSVSKNSLFILYSGTRYTWAEAVSNGLVLSSIFDWNRSTQGYILINGLAPGRGYWVYGFYESELWGTGLNLMASGNYVTALSYRWNIIGVPVNQTINKTTLIVTYQGVDYNWTQATTNDNPTGGPLIVKDLFGWKRTVPQGYQMADTLQSGYCYWMYAYYNCVLKRQL